MDYYDLKELGDRMTTLIKSASWFPFKSGHLRDHATQGRPYDSTSYRIHFSETVAPYVVYLEEGTSAHNIIGAFIGRKKALKQTPPFGSYGRFDGKFHPGSQKHKDFIKNDTVRFCINYIAQTYGGRVEIV